MICPARPVAKRGVQWCWTYSCIIFIHRRELAVLSTGQLFVATIMWALLRSRFLLCPPQRRLPVACGTLLRDRGSGAARAGRGPRGSAGPVCDSPPCPRDAAGGRAAAHGTGPTAHGKYWHIGLHVTVVLLIGPSGTGLRSCARGRPAAIAQRAPCGPARRSQARRRAAALHPVEPACPRALEGGPPPLLEGPLAGPPADRFATL